MTVLRREDSSTDRFPAAPGSLVTRSVSISPRLVVNSIRAAVASAVQGHGVTRLLSSHVAEEVAAGQLSTLLTDCEPPPHPVHLVVPAGRLAVPKVGAFVDFVRPRLQEYLRRHAVA